MLTFEPQERKNITPEQKRTYFTNFSLFLNREGVWASPKEISVRLKWKIPHGHKKGHKELRSGHPDQCLNNMTHGQNLSSTSGEPEFVAQ